MPWLSVAGDCHVILLIQAVSQLNQVSLLFACVVVRSAFVAVDTPARRAIIGSRGCSSWLSWAAHAWGISKPESGRDRVLRTGVGRLRGLACLVGIGLLALAVPAFPRHDARTATAPSVTDEE